MSSQTRMNWWSPLDERRNVFIDIILSPVAFDLIAQIHSGHLFHCVRVFLWVNCVHADWGGQFSGHGVVCWLVLLLLFLFLVIIFCLFAEEDSGCPDSSSNFTKNTWKILRSFQHHSEMDGAPALRCLLLCFGILSVTALSVVLITSSLTLCTLQIK